MKTRVLLSAAFILLMTGTSITAQESAGEAGGSDKNSSNVKQEAKENSRDNGGNGMFEKRIGVELSDEAAVIIDGKKITLSEAIIKAIEQNPDIYISKYEAAMADTDSMKYNARYSAFLNAEGGISSATYPEFLYPDEGKKINSANASVSLAKAFSTGTTVVAGAGYTSLRLNTGPIRTETMGVLPEQKYELGNPVLFASIQQEFLKNAFGHNERKMEKILRNATEMKRDAYVYSMSMIAFMVMVDYCNVVIAQNQLDNARLMLVETKKVRRIVAEKVEIGLSEKFEMNYWNSLVASSKASVTQAEQNYKKAMRKFYRDMNIDNSISMQEKVVLSDRLPEINAEAAIKTAYAKRVDYLNAVRSLENARLSLQMNENNSLPSLKGIVSVSSMDFTEESAGEACANTYGMKYPSYSAKLSMSYPLDDTNQKADERNAAWIVEQSRQKLETARRLVKDDVTTKIENVTYNYQLYTEAKEARKQAELYYNNMLTNLKRGRFAASSVRDAMNGLVKTREMELQLLVLFNASLIEFEVSKNELFDTYKIDVNKYIPKE